VKPSRLAAAFSILLACGCGGGLEDVADVGDAFATRGTPDAAPVVLVGVTGTITRVAGSWPLPPSIAPAAERVVLVKTGGRFVPRTPRLEDAQIAAEVWSSPDGAFAVAAPPGDYFLYAVSRERLANDRATYTDLDGGPPDVRLEAGKPVRRGIVINGYID